MKRSLSLATVTCLLLAVVGKTEAADYVWIEGEGPAHSNIQTKEEGAARPYLSQDKWLHFSFEAANVEKEVPESGVLLSYDFNIAAAGQHEIWNRIGYEASRSAFDWRVDGGEWTTVATDVPTLDFGDFKEKLTQYRTERGWFGDNNFTFNLLPTGNQKFGGVAFNIFDFPTSPVPTAIMLGAGGIPNNPPEEVKDIPIGKKADALFFLHTARIDARRNGDEIRDNKKFEMARYVIHYADGQSETVPVYAEIDIDDFRVKEPKALPGAQLAWTSKYEGTEYSAAAYMKQWNNPRPDVAIQSIDFVYGADRRGVPVLLAITAATAGQ